MQMWKRTVQPMKLTVWTWFGVLACLAAPGAAFADRATVLLKNGAELSGELLEYVPGDHVTLGIGEGRRVVFNASEIGTLSVGPRDSRGRAAEGGMPVDDGGARDASGQGSLSRATSALRLNARLMLGVGGEAEIRAGNMRAEPTDNSTTYGFSLGIDVPVHPNVSFGGFLQFSEWNLEVFDDANVDGSTLWELAVFPKLRYPIKSGRGRFELYAGPVLGVSHNSLNEEVNERVIFAAGVEGSTLGLLVGVFGGASYFISPSIGVGLEFGYQHRSYSFGGASVLEIGFGQLGLNASLVVLL